MRVTHVITRLIVGGAQENTAASVLGLHAKPGMKVELISGPSQGSEGSLEHWFDSAPGVLRVIPELVRPVSPWTDLRALRRLRQTFVQEKPDIVHTHSGKAGIIGRLAAFKAKVPVIIHTIHGPSFGRFQGFASNLVYRALERQAGKRTDHFVVVADAMQNQYLDAGIGRAEQYSKVLSGFPLEPFLQAHNASQIRQKYGVREDDIVIGKIARLVPLKGHEGLFSLAPDFCARHPKAKFLLLGDGPLKTQYEAAAARAGVSDKFIFAGLVKPADVPSLLGIMDIVVHLSYREGLPRALPQALAAGKPVVAYDCDGAKEVCVPAQTGFLVEPGRIDVLAERLSILVQNPQLRQKLGETGREFVRTRFSVQVMVDALYELYQRLLHDRTTQRT